MMIVQDRQSWIRGHSRALLRACSIACLALGAGSQLAGEETQLVPLGPSGGFTGGEGNVYPPGWTLAPLAKISISDQYSIPMGLKEDGTIVGWGGFGRGGIYAAPEGLARDVCSGAFYQTAVMVDGSVRVWGNSSSSSNPSVPPTLTDAVSVVLNGYTAYALRADGTVVSWPDTSLPTVNSGFSRICTSFSRPMGLRGSGEVATWGGWATTYPPPVSTASGVLGADADFSSAIAILADGSAVRWAGGGQALPAGPWTDVVVAGDINLYKRPDGRVFISSYGGASERANSVGSRSMDSNGTLSAVVRADGSLDLWHTYSPLPAGPKGIGRVVDAVIAYGSGGSNMAGGGLALLDDGSLQSWGGTSWTTPGGSGFVSIAASNQAGYAVRGDGTVATFGYNAHSGTYPTDAVVVQAASSHAAVLCRDGRVEVRSMYAMYASAPTTALAGSVAMITGEGWTLGLKADGSIAGWGIDDSLSVRNIPGDLGRIAQLVGFGDFAAVRRVDGTVRAWGGLASVPSGISDAVDIAACNGALAILRSDGTVQVWEKPGRLRTVQPSSTDRVRKLCGGAHPIALRTPAPLLRGHPESGASGTVTVPALWNWPVTGFDASDVVVGNGSVVAVTGGGDTYAVEVRPDGPGLVTIEVRRGAATNALGWPSMEARTTYTAMALTAQDVAVATAEGIAVAINVPNPNAPVTVVSQAASAPVHGTLGAFSGGSATYTPTAGYIGSDSFTYRLGNGSYWSPPATVTVTVSAINRPPTLDQPSDVITPEDGVPHVLVLSGIGPGRAAENGQVLSIAVSSSAPGIVPAPTVTYTSPSTTGSLAIIPVPNAYGTADITVSVRDDGGTASGGSDEIRRTFRVDVRSVNDPPTLAFIPALRVLEDAPEQTWNLTSISAGPANESGQALVAQAFSTASEVVGHPVIDHLGGGTAILRWQPQPDAHGTARIYVTFIDDGGTADGGADSASQSFVITVDPVNDPPSAATAAWQVNPSTDNYIPFGNLSILDVDGQAPATLVGTVTGLPAAGVLSIRGSPVAIGHRFTMQDILDHAVTYLAPSVEGGHQLAFTVGDGTLDGLGPYILDLQVTGQISNLPPVFGLGGVAQWQEDLPPVPVDANATVTDIDSPDFDGGEVSAAVTLHGSPEDILAVRAAGGVQVSGTDVLVSGVAIGTVSGGTGGAPLLVRLNANATPANVERLVRAVSFSVASAQPATEQRTVEVVVRDGDSPANVSRTAQVQVIPVNSPPVVVFPRVATAIIEGSGAMLLDDLATCSDEDSDDFTGGRVSVAFVGGNDADDRLALADHGQITIAGDKVQHAGGEIGTWSGGGTAPLVVDLNASCTPEKAQALLRSVTVENVSDAPAVGTRIVRATVEDGDGGSGSADLGVFVAAVNDAPEVLLGAGTVSWRQGDPPGRIDGDATVIDIDSLDFAGGRLTASISTGADSTDQLVIGDHAPISVDQGDVVWSGTVIGSVTGGDSGTSPLVVTLTAAATPVRVQDLLRALAFRSIAAVPATQDRLVAVVVEDGDGGSSPSDSRTVGIVRVNLPPVIGLTGGAAGYVEDGLPVALDADATVSDADSADFANGWLRLTASDADDRLSIANLGQSAGDIGVAGATVTWGGIAIGSVSGGTGSDPLIVSLLASATPARVQDLLRAVRYASVSQDPAATQSVLVILNDGDEGSSPGAVRTVAITAVNDAPTAAPTVLTAGAQAASGTWTAQDPEGDPVVWSLVEQPSNGTITLDDPARGAWSFVPSGTGLATATLRVTDSHGAAPADLVVPVVITGPADPRPAVASDPPLHAELGTTWTWELQLARSDVADPPSLEVEAIGAPAGLTTTIDGAWRATVTWLVPSTLTAGSHVRFLLRISDRTSGRSSLVPVLIHLRTAIGGGG